MARKMKMYTTKVIESVCMCVYTHTFRRALRYRAETWHVGR